GVGFDVLPGGDRVLSSEWNRWPHLFAHAQLNSVAASLRHEPAASCVAGAPGPKRRLQPIAVARQVGDGMILTADAMRPPIRVDTLIVNRMEARQLGEQMTGEPDEYLGSAHTADRHFQIVTTPTPLPVATGGHQPLAEQV